MKKVRTILEATHSTCTNRHVTTKEEPSQQSHHARPPRLTCSPHANILFIVHRQLCFFPSKTTLLLALNGTLTQPTL